MLCCTAAWGRSFPAGARCTARPSQGPVGALPAGLEGGGLTGAQPAQLASSGAHTFYTTVNAVEQGLVHGGYLLGLQRQPVADRKEGRKSTPWAWAKGQAGCSARRVPAGHRRRPNAGLTPAQLRSPPLPAGVPVTGMVFTFSLMSTGTRRLLPTSPSRFDQGASPTALRRLAHRDAWSWPAAARAIWPEVNRHVRCSRPCRARPAYLVPNQSTAACLSIQSAVCH